MFVAPDFPRYRTVSRQVREILTRHTDLIEPLSLDEAYLDVTENKAKLPTATQVARTIRKQIRTELNLTASGPTLLVDTREQNPFNFSRFRGWFAGVEKKAHCWETTL